MADTTTTPPTFGLADGMLTLAIAPHSPYLAFGVCALCILRNSKWGSGLILDWLDGMGMEIPNDKLTRFLLPGAAYHLPALPPPSRKHNPSFTERLAFQRESIPARQATGDVDPFADDTQAEAARPAVSLKAALACLPKIVPLRQMKFPQSSTSIPLGIGSDSKAHWIDLATDALHIGLYGQTNAGKDNLLRCWFILLCKRNAPEQLQFVVLDSKSDWLVPQLAGLAHLWIDPVGGYGKAGDQAILRAINLIDSEVARRQKLIVGSGFRTREQFITKTGSVMPLLIVMLTDVMSSINGEVETLLENLVSKARAFGVRVIVSMQTPTGKSQRWRSNLATVLAGAMQDRSQDAPALGLSERSIVYRPSLLPPPRQYPGVFVARTSGNQLLIQAPYLSDEDFDTFCETLPQRSVLCSEPENASFEDAQNIQNRTEQQNTEQNIEEYDLLGDLISKLPPPDKEGTIRALLKRGLSQRAVAEQLRAAGMGADTNLINRIAKELRLST